MNGITARKSRIGISFDASSGDGREKAERPAGSKSEKGVVLVVVLVMSAVVLALITALIYMVTSGTQISGSQKRYKSSLEAAKGGTDLYYSLMGLRGDSAENLAFEIALSAAGLTSSMPIMTPPLASACRGTDPNDGTTLRWLAAKLKTPSTSWVNCNTNLTIDPSDPTTYDVQFQLGATTRYNYYGKIVQTIDGISGPDFGLEKDGVASGGDGAIAVMPNPYLYAVEVLATSATNTLERAKLSILYQY